MSYVRVWIHAVWGTKNREALLPKEVRSSVMTKVDLALCRLFFSVINDGVNSLGLQAGDRTPDFSLEDANAVTLTPDFSLENTKALTLTGL
jgi:hypothetical protein